MTINDVYLPYLELPHRTQIFFGGSSSGKSVFLSQRAVLDVLRGGRNYLIVRAVAKTIKRSVFTEIKRVIDGLGANKLFHINETDMTITCTSNGYQILFSGLDDVEKLKSITPQTGAITDVWLEEATEASRNDLKQLLKRQRGGDEHTPKRLTLSFNPILQLHWIYEEYFKPIAWTDEQTIYNGDDLFILKTTYLDNQFLTAQDIHDLQNERDEYYRDVYTLGKWGVLGDVIFRNWRVEDLSGMRDAFDKHRNGLDFGFGSHPAALVHTHYDAAHKIIYVLDELYLTGATNDVLAQEIKSLIGDESVTCDSAEPKSIAELQRFGVNAVAAKKGKDSVNFGIDWLRQQEIVIDVRCINFRNELQLYHWKKDKYGNAMREPVDANNHAIDALRYAYEMDMLTIDAERIVDWI